nr:hypothetical protein [Moraxella sp. CTOTU48268]
MSKGNRYFAVKIKLYMPWVSNPKAWSSTYIEDLLFDEEEYRPSHAYIEESAKEAFGLFDRIEILNIEELTKADFEHITKDGDWTDKNWKEQLWERKEQFWKEQAIKNSQNTPRRTPVFKVLDGGK